MKVSSSEENNYIILDKVFSKLYFFSEKSMMNNSLGVNYKEMQLNNIYKNILDCHQISESLYCISNGGVFKIDFYVKDDSVFLEDK